MPAARLYGDAVARSFGMTAYPRLTTRSLRNSQVAINRLSLGPAQLGMSPQIPPEDTFIVAVYLTELEYHELWSKGRPKITQGYARHAMRIVNLLEEFSANILHPHEAVNFYLPRDVLNEFTDEASCHRITALACTPGVVDPFITGIVNALLPAFERPAEVSTLFIDHVAQALCAHLVHRYGGLNVEALQPKGGLASYQLRRAQELMAVRYVEDVSLSELARECGLSRSHFTRAFRITTGQAPYQWLQRHRVDVVKQLLKTSSATIADIAMSCGFADQSHMTRVFSRLIGESPAAWRRRFRQ